MPSLTAKVCAHPGCAQVVHQKYCVAHAKTERKHRTRAWNSGTAAQRGYGYRWQKVRAAYLARHPLCVVCLSVGRTTVATVVDHIIPHRGDQALMWDSQANFQSLCAFCHNRKTASEPRWHDAKKENSSSGH